MAASSCEAGCTDTRHMGRPGCCGLYLFVIVFVYEYLIRNPLEDGDGEGWQQHGRRGRSEEGKTATFAKPVNRLNDGAYAMRSVRKTRQTAQIS